MSPSQGRSVGQCMDHLVAEASKRGLLIMLDMHCLTSSAGITDLWHMDEAFPEGRLLLAWTNIVKRSPPPPPSYTPILTPFLARDPRQVCPSWCRTC